MWVARTGGDPFRFTCTTGGLEVFYMMLRPKSTTSMEVGQTLTVEQPDPWSAYKQSPFTTSFTNGSGSTPSTVSFSNSILGYDTGTAPSIPVLLNGSLNVTTSSGGLLTIQP